MVHGSGVPLPVATTRISFLEQADLVQQRPSSAAPARGQGRPWSAVLSSKPLWGATIKDRPVAMGAFPAAYRNMQPEVKHLATGWEGAEDNFATRVKDKAQRGLAGGLQALLVDSIARQDQVENAVEGTGKGSRMNRAKQDMERRIQERIDRLHAKERGKEERDGENSTPLPKPGPLTGWHDRTQSAPDVPNPEGEVVSVSSSSLGYAVNWEGKQKEEMSREHSDESIPSRAGTSVFRSPAKSPMDGSTSHGKGELAKGLSFMFRDSHMRARTYSGGKGTDIGTGKGSRIAKAELERELKIQERMKRLQAKEESGSRDEASSTGQAVPNSVSSAESSDVPPGDGAHVSKDGITQEQSTNVNRKTDGITAEKNGSIFEGNFTSELDTSTVSQEDDLRWGSWSGEQGRKIVQRTSRKADSQSGGRRVDAPVQPRLSEASCESSDSQKKSRIGLRVPYSTSKYSIAESDSGGILRVRSGDSLIDRNLGLARAPSEEEKDRTPQPAQNDVFDARSPAEMLRSGELRWAKKLQLGAQVLQRSLRCHSARAQHREMVLLMASADQVHKRQKGFSAAMSHVGAAGKIKQKLARFRSLQNHEAEDDQLVEACRNAIPRLRACHLCENMQDFLNTLELHGATFSRLRDHLPPEDQFHFEEAFLRADEYARSAALACDADAAWTPAGASSLTFHASDSGEQYIRLEREPGILKAHHGEDAPRLARALEIFLEKLSKSTKIPIDRGKMPSLEMAARWLRMHKYNAAHALAYYEKLLAISESWPMESGKLVSVWKPRDEDFIELENRGLRLLRRADGRVLNDQYGGAVAIIDAHRVYVHGKHSLPDMQAILMLFFHSLGADCPGAMSHGVSVVVNMTQIHHGGFYYTMARDLHAYCREVFPTHLVSHVWFYGARGLYGAGFLTATKLVFKMMYENVAYIECAAGDLFDESRLKEALQIEDTTSKIQTAPLPSRKALATTQPVIQRTVSAFTRLLSLRSQGIELERNNMEQQALLYRDGWYGHYDTSSNDKHEKPFFEGGSKRLKMMRKKRPKAADSTECVQVDEVQGFVCGIEVGIARTRVVHAESLAKACTGALARICRPAVHQSGGIKPLITMIECGDAQEKRAAALALAKTCIGNPQGAQKATDCNALISLVNAANCGPEQTRANVCEAIAEICKAHEPACRLAFESHAIQAMIKCVENGVGATKRQALRAIAAICSCSEASRRECALSHGWFVIFTGLESSDVLVQSSAAASMCALFSDVGDPYKVVKGVRELDGLALLAKMLHSEDLEAVANASAALAMSMESDMASVEYFLRCGAVHAMLAACQRCHHLNTLMASMAADDAGMCNVDDLREKWAEEYCERIDLHLLEDCLHMLSPEREDRVKISEWFECQRHIALAFRLAFHSEVCYAGRNLAEEAGSEILRFPDGIKLLYQLSMLVQNYPIDESRHFGEKLTLQEQALGALAGLMHADNLVQEAVDQLINLNAIASVLAVLREGCHQLQV